MNRKAWIGLRMSLGSVVVFWWALLAASIYDLQYSGATYQAEIKVSSYIILGGLTLAAFMILVGFRFADSAHASDEGGFPRAVYRLASLMLVLVLVGLAVFAFGTFISSFNNTGTTTLVGRLVGVYLPIVLAAGVVVVVLLQSMMKRKSVSQDGPEMSSTQKALAIGYSLPILGTAVAVILGMILYDAQGKQLQIWSWVVIQAIIAVSIVFGTKFAAKARSGQVVVRAPKVAGASGAVALNYVLSIVFAAVVSVMSFTFQQAAVDSLRNYGACDANGYCAPPTIGSMDYSWWMDKLLPSFIFLLIALGAVFVAVIWRNREVKN